MIYKPHNPIFPTVLAVAIVLGIAGLITVTGQGNSPAAVVAATGDNNLTVGGPALGSSTSALNPDEAILIADIQKINSITFDTSILSEPAFVGFTNFVQPVSPPVAGRVNPFAPLGSASVINPSPSSSSSKVGHH